MLTIYLPSLSVACIAYSLFSVSDALDAYQEIREWPDVTGGQSTTFKFWKFSADGLSLSETVPDDSTNSLQLRNAGIKLVNEW